MTVLNKIHTSTNGDTSSVTSFKTSSASLNSVHGDVISVIGISFEPVTGSFIADNVEEITFVSFKSGRDPPLAVCLKKGEVK